MLYLKSKQKSFSVKLLVLILQTIKTNICFTRTHYTSPNEFITVCYFSVTTTKIRKTSIKFILIRYDNNIVYAKLMYTCYLQGHCALIQ